MSLRESFQTRLKESLKNRDQTAVSTLRLILAALKDRDIALRGQGRGEGLSESEILSLLQSMVKQRQESAKIYREAARPELADREETEIAIIETFLPRALDETQTQSVIETIIKETNASTIKDMGAVMNALKTGYAGQIDMGKVGALVRARLTG